MKLIEQYPELLRNEPVFRLIQEVFQGEVEMSHSEWEDLFNQFFIETATWGLYKWEQFAGLPISEGLDNETRRGNVLAALRSKATSTKDRIRIIAESYANGECQVIEEADKYMFYIKFNGEKGIPKRLDELKKSIDNIKPAHLAYEFVFSFLTWQEFDDYDKTWDQWDGLDLTWNELEVYSEKEKQNFAPVISYFKISAITKNSLEISYKMQDEKPGTVRHYVTLESFYSDKNITEVVSMDSEGYKYLITGLQPKTTYRIKIKCTDEEGLSNESEFIRATTHEEVINLAPVVSNLKYVSKDMNSIDIQYDAQDEDISTVKHYITVNDLYVEKDITNLISQVDGKYRYKIEGLTQGTSYDIKIKCVDSAKLSAESSITISTDKPANKAPKISNLRRVASDLNSITIQYGMTDENPSKVHHFLTVGNAILNKDITTDLTKKGKEYKYKISNLAKDTSYNITLKCTDEEGLSVESNINASTNKPENKAPNIAGLTVLEKSNNSITIQYNVNDEDVSSVKHYITVGDLYTNKDITSLVSLTTSGYKYVIDGLAEGTSYEIKIKATDKEGLSTESAPITESTLVSNKAPKISNLREISKTDNSITIQYHATDEDINTVKHFIDSDGSYKEITNSITSLGANEYKYTISNLKEKTSYSIKIKLEDKEGLSTESSPITIITPEAPKVNQPPKVIGLKTTGATTTTIDISYVVEDENIDAARHYLYVVGVWIGRNITSEVKRKGNEFTYTITGLSKGITYDIKVEINDGEFKGNSSILGTTANEEVKPPDPEPIQANIVGFKIDESNSDSKGAVTYIEDNAGYTPAEGTNFKGWEGKWPFNQIKPCFLKKGKVVGYLKPFEYTRMEDGVEIDDTGDVMMEYPRMYWNFKREGNYLEVRLSDKKINDTYVCPPFMKKGKECGHAYLGGYYASEINGRMASLPGKTPITNKGKIALRNLAGANGEGYEQLIPYIWTLEQILQTLFYKSLDSQRNLGVGPNYALTKEQTGATKLSGLFAGDATQFSNVKFLGIENLWGSGTTTLDGMSIKNKQLCINQTGHPADGDVAVGDFTGMSGWNTSQAGYMSKCFGTNKGCFFPLEFNGSDSTYYGDDCYVESDNSDYTCYVGGDASGGLYKNGIFYLQQFTDPSAGGGGRLYFGRLTYVG